MSTSPDPDPNPSPTLYSNARLTRVPACAVDVRLLQRVPYEGVSRMQTSLRRRHRDRVVRRGIGMTIESDVSSPLEYDHAPPHLPTALLTRVCPHSSTPPTLAARTSATS